ncbi:MAG: Uma2 family endonuclease, partial [Actinomycetia bacterium]|nr:Uma2 family endonuclease [Actinomycetes bacterium]
MATEPAVEWLPPELWPGFDELVTEDDTPVDNLFSEKQQRLLTGTLYSAHWTDRSFVAMANVGLFYASGVPPAVPDMLLSLDVEAPDDMWPKQNRSYFVAKYGKVPEVVIEVVSNREGGEDTTKPGVYAGIGVSHYVIFDPDRSLGAEVLRLHRLDHGRYVPTARGWLSQVGLGLALWEGSFE